MSVADVDLDEFMPDGELQPETPKRARPGASRRMPHRRMRRRPTPPPDNYYPDAAAFVKGFIASMYAHEWSQYGHGEWRWCSNWWLHTEAVVRLEALWKAWELLRLDPGTGASTWLLVHADPQMAALTATTGPFSRCKPDAHTAPEPLPVLDPPPGMF